MQLIARHSPDILLPRDPHRSQTLIHVSQIRDRIGTILGKTDYERNDDFDPNTADPITRTRIEIGVAWEDWFGAALVRQAIMDEYHPGELRLDGVAGTPDGRARPKPGRNQHCIIDEIKATWKDSKKFDLGISDSWWAWTFQVMSYCWMDGREVNGVWMPVQRARVWPLFIRGELYGYAPMPPVAYEFKFGYKELRDHWALCVRTARELEQEKQAKQGGHGNETQTANDPR